MEESLFCNKCGSKIASSGNSLTDILKGGSQFTVANEPNVSNSNEKDRFPVKALIIIILIVSAVGLFSLYDHLSEDPPMNLSDISSSKYSYNDDSTDITTESDYSWSKSAGSTTGFDWLDMNNAQKLDIVSGVIMDWELNNFEILAGSSYFISALDAFYGDESTNSNNLAEAMTMIGLSGNVLSKE
ncbi:hypothetical protein [Paenibacillus sp. FSL R7-0273]|uniref:hypothetical protein n=1 Tax=Paenibacillus sp. FSL R7-0273 TaxID=1536772 RepID=UPI0015C3BC1F|nr:hypothetical protein [Paenibacillus sp. FSL R7-0273]